MMHPNRISWALAMAAGLLIAVPFAALAQSSHSAEEHSGHEHGHQHDHQIAEHDTDYRHHTGEHDFSDAEEWAARFDSPERAAWQKPAAVAEMMAIEPGMTVVDLGAGTGYFLPYLSKAAGDGGKVLALDPEADMIRFISERARREKLGNVEARQIPFDDPELAAASVDRVLIVNTWHHIGERADYAKKLLAALKPGGRVYIVDFDRDSPSGPPVQERLEPELVIGELLGGGLQAEMVKEELPRQYVVVGQGSR
ncbi:MAG: methyltransferase domain-containing protein [bacterium]|nr:methyltransferase domain-containing protein [bacterium]